MAERSRRHIGESLKMRGGEFPVSFDGIG